MPLTLGVGAPPSSEKNQQKAVVFFTIQQKDTDYKTFIKKNRLQS